MNIFNFHEKVKSKDFYKLKLERTMLVVISLKEIKINLFAIYYIFRFRFSDLPSLVKFK